MTRQEIINNTRQQVTAELVEKFRKGANNFVGTKSEIDIHNRMIVTKDHFIKDKYLAFCDKVERGEI